MSDDYELLDRWHDGDNDAGNELFERHFNAVVWFFKNKVGADVLEDLVQEAFAACVQATGSFRRTSRFRTFVLGVANNVLRSHYRKRERASAREVDFGVSSVADLGPSPSAIAAQRSEERLLLRALRSIPLDFQVLLELYYWETKTAAEIGEVVGAPEGTVRTRLRRAKELLTEAIATASTTPAMTEATLDGLDDWAASVKK